MSYDERLRRFRAQVAGRADLVFLPISADLQYLTGIPRGAPTFGAVMHPGAWLEGLWMTPARGPVLTLPRMTAEFGGLGSDAVEVRVLGDFDDPAALVRDIVQGFGLGDAPRIAIGDRAHAETVSALHSLLPGARFLSATDQLRPLRAVKSAEEIASMRRAGAITEAAWADVLPKLRHGMTELELVMEIDFQLRRHGSYGSSFNTSLYNAGPDHPLTLGRHEVTWRRAMRPPMSILTDFGAIYEGYCYDFGRTVAFGAPDADFVRVHALVMASQRAGIAAMRAGAVTAAEVDAAARRVIEDAGLGAAFRHRLGHSIGLDVHEPPFLTQTDHTVLQDGMLFTVEPSILFDARCSARVEDVVVARPGGGEPLTAGFQELYVVD
ncbi:MAG: aminopeptidase P family protein [Anaerolineae bacterium]|nr:aminopeptidase P family protein [Anaerolineae bacterium]